jgi:tetratricopeptide (TPR) repeat protein
LIRKAIALNPKVYPRWFHAALGKEHYRKREFQAALVEFKTMNLPVWWWNQVELAYTYGQLGDMANARKVTARLLELYPGFDLEKAALEHRKFSFEQSYIDLAVDGLRKALGACPGNRVLLDEGARVRFIVLHEQNLSSLGC